MRSEEHSIGAKRLELADCRTRVADCKCRVVRGTTEELKVSGRKGFLDQAAVGREQ